MTTKRLILLLIRLAIPFVLNSCKYPCDGFPVEKLIWIPYEMGEKLRYSNGTDTIEFEVIDNYKTEPEYFRGFVMDYECFLEGYYLTNKSDNGYCLKERLSNEGNIEMSVHITENDVFNFFYTSII